MRKIISLLVFATLMTGCTTVPITGRKQLILVPNQEILSMSAQQYSTYMKSAKLSSNKTEAEMVKRVGSKIAEAVETYMKEEGRSAELEGFKWEFNLVEDKSVNAFCMPGGKIVVYEGILPYTKNEAGLATVIGHEVAHAVAKHSSEQISQQMVAQYGAQILATATTKRSEFTRSAIQQIYGIGTQVGVTLPFSRQHEYEADKMGMIFMTIAGYEPSEAINFWKRMASQNNNSFDFLSTHPADAKRIASLQETLAEINKLRN